MMEKLKYSVQRSGQRLEYPQFARAADCESQFGIGEGETQTAI